MASRLGSYRYVATVAIYRYDDGKEPDVNTRFQRRLARITRIKEGRMRHHHHHFTHHGRGGPGHPGRRGGRHRARRGAIVNAVLALLEDGPRHGYELMTELEARTDGRWRPSPGSMYPALSRMEERGLLTSELIDGKKQFSLTDDGRARLAEYRDARGDEGGEPWDDHGTGGRGDLRRNVAELVGQARQIGRFGTQDQIDRAVAVFADTRRQLYGILADDGRSDGSARPADEPGSADDRASDDDAESADT